MKAFLRTISFLAVAVLAAGTSLPAWAQSNSLVRGKPVDFSAFRIITDRNIFDPNRRPQHRYEGPPAPTIVDSFSLTGTMSYDNGSFAIFDGSTSDYHKALGQGGKIAGYTVGQITHDFVKLSSGTNEFDLKVGMQMRRSADGNWSASERSQEPTYAVNSTASRGGNASRRERGRYASGSRNSGASGIGSVVAEGAAPGAMEAGNASPPPGAANLDPNDPVARLMLRRLQETGGNANPSEPGSPEGGPSGGPPANQNGPDQNQAESGNGGTGNSNESRGGNPPPPEPPPGGAPRPN